jgi:hypothetical protein
MDKYFKKTTKGGRKEEQLIMNQLLACEKAEFLAVYGQRRVGKTLIPSGQLIF